MLLQKLSPEELQKLNLKPLGRRHFVRVAIENLEVGEALRISYQAFTWKGYTPKIFCNAIEKKTSKRFTIAKEMSNTSWVVTREQ